MALSLLRFVKFPQLLNRQTPTHAHPHMALLKQQGANSIAQELVVWRWISTISFIKNSDAQHWWSTVGYALAVLLHQADYDVESQYRHLIFFAFVITPELGAAPNTQLSNHHWKSFMTDDNTPVELSWDWGVEGDLPTVRYSIEPIGSDAGTPSDPFNQFAGPQFVRQLSKALPGTDLEWFEHFSKEFLIFANQSGSAAEKHESRFFAAFDLHQNDIILKAYFFPAFKAIETGKSRLTVISEAFTRLPNYRAIDYQAFRLLQDYIESPPTDAAMEVEMLAIDCVRPVESRFKIYTRSRSTSFDSVKLIMTLAGKIRTPEMSKGLDELRILWEFLFGLDRASSEELPHTGHRTAGILYNFELRPGTALPVPKIYIPVRHYAANDDYVIDRLQTYLLRCRGRPELMEKYHEAITALL